LGLYGFSLNKMKKLKANFFQAVEHPVHANSGSVVLTDKRAEALSFMRGYFEENCDKMPNPAGNRDTWNLPSTATKEDVYRLYKEYHNAFGDDESELVSSLYFKDLWAKEFPHVTIPVRSRFKQCTECVPRLALVPRYSRTPLHSRPLGSPLADFCFVSQVLVRGQRHSECKDRAGA